MFLALLPDVGGTKNFSERRVNKMSIEKKSLISTLKTTKKANVAKEDFGEATKHSAVQSASGKVLSVKGGKALSIKGGKALSVKGGKALSMKGGKTLSVKGGRVLSVKGGKALSVKA
jgi:hypothetical protein